MKSLLHGLNKAFDSRVRLGIMSILMINDRVEFNTMKELLELSDGNLASHTSALEKVGYLTIHKEFRGKKPLTSYTVSAEGKLAFKSHLDALENLIRTNE